jgi:P-type Ca2+ transporter type 2C
MGWDLREYVVADISKILVLLKTSFKGLSAKKAEELFKIYGPNEIEGVLQKSLFTKIIESFIEPMVIILFVASAFSLVIGNRIEAFAILGVVFINTAISLIQDGKAERAVEALKKMLSPQFRLLRNGTLEVIASRFIVPGDILVFESGDIIPADARIIEAKSVLADDAHLTGESEPIEKISDAIDKSDLRLYEMKNILFAGTKILRGYGKAVAVNTGGSTEMGKIAGNIQETDIEKTPLQKKLSREIKYLVVLAVISACFVFILTLFQRIYPFNTEASGIGHIC